MKFSIKDESELAYFVMISNDNVCSQIKIVKGTISYLWVNPTKLQNEPLNNQSDFVWFANLSSKYPIQPRITSEIVREFPKESFEELGS